MDRLLIADPICTHARANQHNTTIQNKTKPCLPSFTCNMSSPVAVAVKNTNGKRLLAYARLQSNSSVPVPADIERATLEAANNAHSSQVCKSLRIMLEPGDKEVHTIAEQEQIMRVASKITALGPQDLGTSRTNLVVLETMDLMRSINHGSTNSSPLLSALNSLLWLSPAICLRSSWVTINCSPAVRQRLLHQ